MILVVSGTRKELPIDVKFRVLRQLKRIGAFDESTEVYVGDATGVDALVKDYASATVFAADWDKHGKRAGPLRNKALLTEAIANSFGKTPVVLLAFPGRGSKGTVDCIRQAAGMGIEIHVYPVNV
jgi:hypothetical protein